MEIFLKTALAALILGGLGGISGGGMQPGGGPWNSGIARAPDMRGEGRLSAGPLPLTVA